MTDLLIIGGGSAAFAAAIKARELGRTALIVEAGPIGGTCLNVGCVPSKVLVFAADTAARKRRFPWLASSSTHAAGVEQDGSQTNVAGAPIDASGMFAWRDVLIDRLRQEKYADVAAYYGIDVVFGRAAFEAPDAVRIERADGRVERRTFRRALIATGSRPRIPDLPGADAVDLWTSDDAVRTARVPTSLIILGAGAVGLELAGAFSALGSRVTVVTRRQRLLPKWSAEAAALVHTRLTARGVDFIFEATPLGMKRTAEGATLVVQVGGSEAKALSLHAERLLVAVGREPNTAALNLEAAGIAVDPSGAVRVDASFRTTHPAVYAAGDVAGMPQFVYVAARSGALAAENALTGSSKTLSGAVPEVLFLDPPLARVGLDEYEARARGLDVVVGTVAASDVVRTAVEGVTDGFIRLVAERAGGRLIGAEIAALHAEELILPVQLAIDHGLALEAFRETLAAYLTMGEGLRLAALNADAAPAPRSCCAG